MGPKISQRDGDFAVQIGLSVGGEIAAQSINRCATCSTGGNWRRLLDRGFDKPAGNDRSRQTDPHDDLARSFGHPSRVWNEWCNCSDSRTKFDAAQSGQGWIDHRAAS
jgi:hypothetical protein